MASGAVAPMGEDRLMVVQKRARRVLGLVLALITAGGAVVLPATVAEAAPPFDPGHIISDGVFYDSATMNAPDIQSFLRAHNSGCRSGYVCLYDYRETTFSRAADAQCAAYDGVANELASNIIDKVAHACGVNPRSLIVLLQKETSLVTRTDPTWDNAYRTATGYGCPDTAPCDAQYFGFYNQVYRAAWQFRNYARTAATRTLRAGQLNFIAYSPSTPCGGSNVYIVNQATAGLYTYTPYQPTATALAGGPSDGCTSYGNLNFYRLFNQWFGSTSYSLLEAIAPWYGTGTNAALMGDPVADGVVVAGGLNQRFALGNVYVSGVGGLRPTVGLLDLFYSGRGGPAGSLGFPVSDGMGAAGGLRQDFQGGSLFVSGRAGAVVVTGWVRSAYLGSGGPAGVLGFPTADQWTVAGGLAQPFENGSFYVSGIGGAQIVLTQVNRAFTAAGGPAGALGFPLGSSGAVAGGLRQDFQGGSLYVGPSTSGSVAGWMRDAYVQTGGPGGPLGFPVAGQRVVAGGLAQSFSNGTLYISGVGGARVVPSAVDAAYTNAGGPAALGFPVGDSAAVPGGYQQQLQSGSFYVSATTGASSTVTGWIQDIYLSSGGPGGSLGFPVAGQQIINGGLYQRFEGGSVLVSGVGGVRIVRGALNNGYVGAAGPAGVLGYPTGDEAVVGGRARQQFQGGLLVSDGAASAWPVTGWIRDFYVTADAAGQLGGPREVQRVVSGGLAQTFGGGSVYVSGVGGIRAVLGAVDIAYSGAGGPAGGLGFPTSAQVATADGGSQQLFQRGVISVGPAGQVTVALQP